MLQAVQNWVKVLGVKQLGSGWVLGVSSGSKLFPYDNLGLDWQENVPTRGYNSKDTVWKGVIPLIHLLICDEIFCFVLVCSELFCSAFCKQFGHLLETSFIRKVVFFYMYTVCRNHMFLTMLQWSYYAFSVVVFFQVLELLVLDWSLCQFCK